MEGGKKWVGARIRWRLSVSGSRECAVAFDGLVEDAQAFADGVTRLSGALSSGGRFVLVTDEPDLTTQS